MNLQFAFRNSFLLMIIFQILPIDSQAAESKRSKSISFEDELIEGINRKPLDQFNQISEIKNGSSNHLYRKRKTFQDRNRILSKEWNRGLKP